MTTGTGEEWKGMHASALAVHTAASQAAVAEARARIPRLRMRDVTLRLCDRRGAPLRRVPVQIAQTRSAFPVGDQLWKLDTLHRFGQAETDLSRAFTTRFTELFNAANALCYWTERPRNDGPKMEDRQGEPHLESFAACVDWAAAAGLTVKGHPLFWAIQKCVPDWVQRYDTATQLKFAEVRVRNLVARFKGRVTLWDAVNEPLWEPAFRNLAQRQWPHLDPIADLADYIALVLGWARDEDPDACYLLNDYGLEGDADWVPTAADGTPVTATRQRARMRALLDALFATGAPPNALGLQSHTGGWLPHDAQAALYDEMAGCGLPLHVTEFWAKTRELPPHHLDDAALDELHAQYVADYLTVAFGHPAVEAFFFWGFMEDAIRWGDYSSHELTPAYHRVRQLLTEEWITRLDAVTDDDGCVRFRGFYGAYALRHALGAAATGVPFTVDRHAGMPLTLTCPLAG
jgi:GH35 family endo-1,4-beta-xylanase